MRDELLLILGPNGTPKKVMHLDTGKIKRSKESPDSLKKVFETKRNPYHMSRLSRKTPMNDPDLFMVVFQKML